MSEQTFDDFKRLPADVPEDRTVAFQLAEEQPYGGAGGGGGDLDVAGADSD
jgi:hypothetical protein